MRNPPHKTWAMAKKKKFYERESIYDKTTRVIVDEYVFYRKGRHTDKDNNVKR